MGPVRLRRLWISIHYIWLVSPCSRPQQLHPHLPKYASCFQLNILIHIPKMSFKLSFAAFAALAAATVVHGAEVQYYTTRSCSGAASQDYRNVACNSCIDPPGGMPIPTSQFTRLTSIIIPQIGGRCSFQGLESTTA